jgi:hypothetical protein
MQSKQAVAAHPVQDLEAKCAAQSMPELLCCCSFGCCYLHCWLFVQLLLLVQASRPAHCNID